MAIDIEAIEARQHLVMPLLPLTYDLMTDYDRDDAGEMIEYALAAGVRSGTGEYLLYVDEPSPAQCALLEAAAHAPVDIDALLAEIECLTALAHAADAWAQAITEIDTLQAALVLLEAVRVWRQGEGKG